MELHPDITIANPHLHFDKVALMEPLKNQFLLLAAQVDVSIFPFHLHTSKKKKRLLKLCKEKCRDIKKIDGVISAIVFQSLLIPPGRGKLLKERPGVPIAKFDTVILIEIQEGFHTDEVLSTKAYTELKQGISISANHTFFSTASNIKRIDSVNHAEQGVFLFNYFYADSLEQNLQIWEYTAGWFQQETGLDNSTVLVPQNLEKSPYKIINHCRWNSLWEILPSLIFKKSFKTYVLVNFYRNNVAAMPILYKLA